MPINPNLINEDLSKEAYQGVRTDIEQIAESILSLLPEKITDPPSDDESTIQALGLLIEEKLKFTNHGTGINTLAKQAELFKSNPDQVVVDHQLDCKLPPIVLGFAVKALYQQLGISKQIYFGLGTPVHPHVLIETVRADGEPEFLDIDYNNVEPEIKNKKTIVERPAVQVETVIPPSVPVVESPRTDDSPMVVGRRKVDFKLRERLENKRNGKSYMQLRHVDNDQMRTRLTNPRYDYMHFTDIDDSDFLRLLDTNFLLSE